MKKSIIISILCCIVAILLVVSGLALDYKYNLRGFFDDWTSESKDDFVFSHFGYNLYFQSEEFSLQESVPHTIDEVFCINLDKERIYFCCSSSTESSDREYYIASVDLSGSDFKEHYSLQLFDSDSSIYHYQSLSHQIEITETSEYSSYNQDSLGGLYKNGKIYLKDSYKTVVYDISTDTVSEVTNLPENRYNINIEDDYKKLIIDDNLSGTSRTITLEYMAERNDYANKLLDLSSMKIYNRRSATEKLFDDVQVIDDNIYIHCKVWNWLGESYAVTFQYDYFCNKFIYIHAQKTIDPPRFDRYSIVPIL